MKGGAAVRLAEDLDKALVLLDDPIDRGQPEPGAFPDPLGGEKRLENMLEGFGADAAAGIRNGQ